MLEKGEIISIDNKEYICVDKKKEDNNSYVFLMSNFKPLEIRFAKLVNIEGNDIKLEIINDQEEKQKLLALFQKTNT